MYSFRKVESCTIFYLINWKFRLCARTTNGLLSIGLLSPLSLPSPIIKYSKATSGLPFADFKAAIHKCLGFCEIFVYSTALASCSGEILDPAAS
jgi:hypothetical protein